MEKMMHAYILIGGSEATLARARELAAAMLCEGTGPKPCHTCRHCRKAEKDIHPDITQIVRVPGKSGKLNRDITVGQIRDVGADAAVLPNEGRVKVYIFPRADEMNPQAQNTFLKLLEEPPAWAAFLLCTDNRDRLLPTIRSRCAEVRVGGEPDEISEQVRERADGFLNVIGDAPELWRWCVNLEKLESDKLKEVVEAIRLRAPKKLRDPAEILALEEFLAKAAEYLQLGVGAKQVTGYLSTYISLSSGK